MNKKITINTLVEMKNNLQPISAITCYDASFAYWFDQAKIEVVLVGDTLGEIIQGNKSTIPVTLADMCYHTKIVSRKLDYGWLIADVPFLQHATLEKSIIAAQQLMQAGACMVKMEGGSWLAPTVAKLTQLGVPVCAHLGYTPQSVHSFGGAKLIGKKQAQAQALIEEARILVDSGAKLLVVECVPDDLGKQLAKELSCPVIGIGAGPYCDGQILVGYDMLGITPGKAPPFAKCFLDQDNPSVLQASIAYKNAVQKRLFPAERS